MIHVAVDANCLAWGWGGIPKVVDRVVRELVALGVRVDLLANSAGPFVEIEGAGQAFVRITGTTLWRELFLAGWVARHRPSVLWAPESVLPRRLSAASVVTLHDLAALLFPGVKPARHRVSFQTAVRRSVRSATRVVAVSRTTAGDAERLFGVPAGDIAVVPNGVDPAFVPGDRGRAFAAVRERFGLDRPFVLAVGALEPRKGLDVLVDVAEEAVRRSVPWDVVLAGAPGFRSGELVARARASDRCHLLGSVSEPELLDLYRAAEALVAPSLYEGFGLTPLEAMACGTPAVVATSSGGLAEVSGGAARLVSDRSAPSWIAAVEAVRSDRARFAEAGLRHAARYGWPRTAEAMLAVFEEAAGCDRHRRGRWRKRTTPR
ncbi:MAG TPA: glycosyltransferase family 1 protein [Gaiellaceae bacterium]|nr:glycosyltransferase family 1 protein [Gaiellaceae bacterium]